MSEPATTKIRHWVHINGLPWSEEKAKLAFDELPADKVNLKKTARKCPIMEEDCISSVPPNKIQSSHKVQPGTRNAMPQNLMTDMGFKWTKVPEQTKVDKEWRDPFWQHKLKRCLRNIYVNSCILEN